MGDITVPAAFIAIVDEKGLMTLEVVNFINLVGDLAISENSGSPEGVLDANISKLYMDTAGTAGNVLYVKRDSNIGGDASLGWIETGNSAATTVELFQARKTTTQVLTASMVDVTGWAAADKEDSPFSFNATTGVLTINSTGWFSISTHIEVSGVGTRSGFATQLVDSVLIPGTFVQGYWRTGNSDTPTIGLASYLYEVTSTPTDINMQTQFNNPLTTLENARLTVIKVGAV